MFNVHHIRFALLDLGMSMFTHVSIPSPWKTVPLLIAM